jgi:hypothetical protein
MRWIALLLVVVMVLGAATPLLARQGPGPCVCDERVDIDPADGFCDVCGGCIPDGDGPFGPRR